MTGYGCHYDNALHKLSPSKTCIKNVRKRIVYDAIHFMLSIGLALEVKYVWSKPYDNDKLDSGKNSFVCRIVTSPGEYDIYGMNVFGKAKSNTAGLKAILQTQYDDNNSKSAYSCQPYLNFIPSDIMYQIDDEIINLSTVDIVPNDVIKYNGVSLNDTTATLILDDKKVFSMEILIKGTPATDDKVKEEEITDMEHHDAKNRKKKKNKEESLGNNNESVNVTNDPMFQQENEPLKEYILSTSNLTDEDKNNTNPSKKTMGILKALIVRIIGTDTEPKFSSDELMRYTFLDDVSLKNQMYRCSAGQLIILPATFGGNSSGVIDVRLTNRSIEGIDRTVLVNEALEALPRILQRSDSSYSFKQESETSTDDSDVIASIADLIMVIVPKGSLPMTWAAYGVVDGRLTVFNDEWGTYVSATMHEVGTCYKTQLQHFKPMFRLILEFYFQPNRS